MPFPTMPYLEDRDTEVAIPPAARLLTNRDESRPDDASLGPREFDGVALAATPRTVGAEQCRRDVEYVDQRARVSFAPVIRLGDLVARYNRN